MRTPHEAGAGCLCIIAKAARLDRLDATGKVDSCDKQNDVASYPGTQSRVAILGASIMSAKISSATSYSVQLQNEIEGKINYFHYQKFNDPTKGTKSPLSSPQTIYDFVLYPGGRFIATTADSLTAPPEDPKNLLFKLTNNSDFDFCLIELNSTDASIKKWLNSDNPTEQPAYKTKYRQRPVLSKQSVTLDFPNGGHWYVGEMPDRKRT